jgi:hypothetical protein
LLLERSKRLDGRNGMAPLSSIFLEIASVEMEAKN